MILMAIQGLEIRFQSFHLQKGTRLKSQKHNCSLHFCFHFINSCIITLDPTGCFVDLLHSFLLAMYKVGLLLASFAAIGFGSTPKVEQVFRHFDCGTNSSHATEELIKAHQAFHANSSTGSPAARARSLARHASRDANAKITVPVYIHIVTTKAKQGGLTTKMAKDQALALNKAYNQHNIYFELKDTSVTIDDDWAVGKSADIDLAMKKALRKGTYGTLNIYMQSDLDGGVLGKCSLPSSISAAGSATAPDPSLYINDGCNVQANTMPGGAVDGYNMGMTAVHETGHWLGLLHTFEGYSCTGDGDFISDTPVQSTSTDGCPVAPPKDSCPNQPGLDAVHNIMDYSTDACYTGFSPLQIDRIRQMWGMYRDGK
jgi:hypothetical protein